MRTNDKSKQTIDCDCWHELHLLKLAKSVDCMVSIEKYHTGCDLINSLVRGVIKTTLPCFEKYNNYVYPAKQHPIQLEQ